MIIVVAIFLLPGSHFYNHLSKLVSSFLTTTMITRNIGRRLGLRVGSVGLTGLRLPLVRLYSNINDFNRKKVDYNYGTNFNSLEELEPKINPEIKRKLQQKVAKDLENQQKLDINSELERDSSLVGLKPNSPEYKKQLHYLHQKYQKDQQKQQLKFEFTERIKGVFLGFLALLGIVGCHQIFMNYNYLKNWIFKDYYYNIDDEKLQDLSLPNKNKKNIDNLMANLSKELTTQQINHLQDSHKHSGIYFTGANKSKIFFRLPFFDGMFFQDVQINGDYLVAITDLGKCYHFYQELSQPTQIHLPSKIVSCQISNDFVYYLTNNGQILYTPKLNKSIDYESHKSRNWFGLLKSNEYGKIDVPEPINQISTGESHLLMLSKSGKLFIANTTTLPNNYGQYGLPALSPFSNPDIPLNIPFPLTLLNNEVINVNGEKTVVPRTFTSIATGKYHSIVVDSSSNVWTWGKNNFGQCGIELNLKTEYNPLPKKILTKQDFKRVCRNIIPKSSQIDDFCVEKVYANSDTSYIQLNYNGESILLSFGTGLKGQLGCNRYLHVCSQPQIVKSLFGLNEFDESTNKIVPIKIKTISGSGDHTFVTLSNVGQDKDVVVFGDNEYGQYGNGKTVKSSKPIQLPRLIEPNEINQENNNLQLTKRLTDVNNFRLSLLDNVKVNGRNIEQVIVGGQDASAIYYKRK